MSHPTSDPSAATPLMNQVATPVVPHTPAQESKRFSPRRPTTLAETGLRDVDVEALMLKSLFTLSAATGATLAHQSRLAGSLVRDTLDRLRVELLITLKGATETGDFVYQLTETGVQRAKQYMLHTTYCGAAPVTMSDYERGIELQSVSRQPLKLSNFREALSDLTLPPDTFSRLAQAVNAGRGLFLYGPPGNGKTSVAERLTRAYPAPLWVPRAITIGGEIIRLYDSSVHVELDPHEYIEDYDPEKVDGRWVLIRRPTIVVGGELMMDHLDLMPSQATGVFEAPIQMKANGGTLVIDDFGRQRCAPEDILNRWIVTLEKRADFLTLPNGRQVRVPFDENLVLATNIKPEELIDEAYLRRIPFKVELRDPDEAVFRALFREVAETMQIEFDAEVLTYVVENFYHANGLPFRYCHPRDLLFQVGNLCELHELPRALTRRNVDVAISNYFFERLQK
ncbi:MAG: AAA family ATPase [Planctomycetales bacterium]|nr:AAA family ATPase [Planctomycetales bacterium]